MSQTALGMSKTNQFAQQQQNFQQRSPAYNNQLPDGGGRCQYDDGGWYAGKWELGMAHGHGVCGSSPMAKDAGEFAGLWQQGFEVNGISRWASGERYEGQWLQGKKHGLGCERKEHWVYRGEWTHGSKGRYGVGQSTTSSLRYDGTWTSGIKDGYGVETYPDEGTYQGQWMRGMRHGYGVRQSAPYIVAMRSPMRTFPNSPSTPSSDSASGQFVSFDRDTRMEENKGGFVLQARTSPPEETQSKSSKRPGIFDRIGRHSLRKSLANELKNMRQKSAGDLLGQGPSIGRPHSAGANSRASSTGGSVRSTTSAFSQISSAFSTMTSSTKRSSVDLEDELGSFCSDVDLANERVTERYAGEWKNDKRSGFGVCERSDGVKFEGEWMNNRKHGYGVTTLADGTRIEGKYKNNVLVSSTKGSKLFALRSNKIRDKVDASVGSAQKAAGMAIQKMEIANVRMTSAKVRADQADEAAKRAVNDAEIAENVARQYTADFQGAQVLANRQQSEGSFGSLTSPHDNAGRLPYQKYDNLQSAQGVQLEPTSKPQRKFAFFKLKKSGEQAKRSKSETRAAQSTGFSLFGNSSLLPNTNKISSVQQEPRTLNAFNQSYESVSNSTLGKPLPPSDFGKDRDKLYQSSVSKFNSSGPKMDISINVPNTSNVWPQEQFGRPENIRTRQTNETMMQVPRSVENTGFREATSKYNDDDLYNSQSVKHRNLSNMYADVTATPANHLNSTDSYMDSKRRDYNTRIEVSSYDQPKYNGDSSSYSKHGSYTVESLDANTVITAWPVTETLSTNFTQPYRSATTTLGAWNHDNIHNEESFRQQSQFPSPANVDRYYNDRLDVMNNVNDIELQRDRRKSLPSIMKEPPMNSPLSLNSPAASTTRTIQISSVSPSKTLLAQNSLTMSKSTSPNPSDHVPTDTYVIENGVRKRVKPVAAAKVTSTLANVPHYELESSKAKYKRGDRGSLPDVSAVSDTEVLPREIVYQMSQRRREELMKEREELERRYGGNIVLRIEDIMDWFWRKRLFILIFIFNMVLVFGFLQLLKDVNK